MTFLEPTLRSRGQQVRALFQRHVAAPIQAFVDHMRDPVRKNLRVTYALLLRESRVRYGGRSAGYIWALLVPAAYLGVFLTIFTLLGRTQPAGDYLAVFFLTGIIPVRLWRGLITRGAGAIRSNWGLMNYPPVRPVPIVTARSILEIGTLAMVGVIFAIILNAFFEVPFSAWMGDPFGVICALLSIAYFCYGTAMLSAQLGRLTMLWGDVAPILGRIAFFSSGVFFTMQSIPPRAQMFIQYNPMAHLIEWFRDAAFASYYSDLYNPAFPLIAATVMLFLALLLEWLVQVTDLESE